MLHSCFVLLTSPTRCPLIFFEHKLVALRPWAGMVTPYLLPQMASGFETPLPDFDRSPSLSGSQNSLPAPASSPSASQKDAYGRHSGSSQSVQVSPAGMASPEGSTQAITPSSAGPLRSPEQVVPTYDNVRRGLRFPDALEERKLAADSREDPLPELLAQARQDANLALGDEAWPNMRTVEEVKATVRSWLEAIADDLWSPGEVAQDLDFDSRKLQPRPRAFHAATERRGFDQRPCFRLLVT